MYQIVFKSQRKISNLFLFKYPLSFDCCINIQVENVRKSSCYDEADRLLKLGLLNGLGCHPSKLENLSPLGN